MQVPVKDEQGHIRLLQVTDEAGERNKILIPVSERKVAKLKEGMRLRRIGVRKWRFKAGRKTGGGEVPA